MKKNLFLVTSLLAVVGAYAQSDEASAEAQVDERVELLSVVFRLAGAEEYSFDEAKNYVADIDAWFAPYREDSLIRYVRNIRRADGIAYDAVARMAVHLEGSGGKYFRCRKCCVVVYG